MPRQLNIGGRRGPGGPGQHFGASAKMPEGGMKMVKRLFGYVTRNYKLSLGVVALCIIITSVTTLVSTLFTRTLIDDYIVPLTQSANPDFAPLARTLFTLAAVLVVGIICSYVNNRLMINVGQGTLLRLRTDLFEHMEQLPIGYFDSHAHGDIMSVYTNDVDTLRQLIGQSIPQVFSSTITISITFVSMCVMSWPLTLLVLLMTSVMIFVTRVLGNRSAVHFKSRQQNLGAMNGYIEEMLTGLKVVKTFCHEDEAIARFEQYNEALRDSSNNANREANIVMPVNGNLSNLIYVLCAIIGATIALKSPLGATLTIGTLVSFLTLIKNFTQPVSHLSQQINSVVMALAGAGRVFDLMDATPEKDEQACIRLVNAKKNADGTLTETSERTGVWAWKVPKAEFNNIEGKADESDQKDANYGLIQQQGEVDFTQVDFSYVPEKQVLFDIELDTDAGQKIALVGGTGAGKTTITNLINRFYDIQDGRILYDHIDIRKIHREDLRRSLGMVLQETHLFTGTVMENIRYGHLDATDEECRAAAELVNADDFILRLSEGYDTMLTADGGNLSQGERQLLAIARAAVANPPTLILDEATSSIDTRTERLVQEGMDHIMEGRSTFVIAHRLSTVRNSDIICVMDHGRIIEQGNHEELLAKQGKYYQLYTGKQID
ncbi:MAG: ABC transporter ATP-binding protein [Bacteroidaceae bacterium]|nr:ABC transporter ATP-binding protein [Bacteroidaceae bacterium]